MNCKLCKVIWCNKGYLAKEATKWTSGLYALLGFIGLFTSYDEIIATEKSIPYRIMIGVAVLAGVWLVFFIVNAFLTIKKERFEIIKSNNGHSLYVQYGNVFNKKEVFTPDKPRNIVIPVNRCFDMRLDNQIVSVETLHGKMLNRLYASKTYTESSLNLLLEEKLKNSEFEQVTLQEKPKGKQKRYPVGTCVKIPGIDKENYLLVALSSFDEDEHARTSMAEYSVALQKMIESCNDESQGYPIVVPIVGAGLSRIKKNQYDILRYMISVFRINKEEINSDIHIIVYEKLKNEISIAEICRKEKT